MKTHFHDGKYGSALAVKMFPGQKSNAVVFREKEGLLEVYLVEGHSEKLNQALETLLCEIFSLNKSQIQIITELGETGRLVIIESESPASIQKRLGKLSKTKN